MDEFRSNLEHLFSFLSYAHFEECFGPLCLCETWHQPLKFWTFGFDDGLQHFLRTPLRCRASFAH